MFLVAHLKVFFQDIYSTLDVNCHSHPSSSVIHLTEVYRFSMFSCKRQSHKSDTGVYRLKYLPTYSHSLIHLFIHLFPWGYFNLQSLWEKMYLLSSHKFLSSTYIRSQKIRILKEGLAFDDILYYVNRNKCKNLPVWVLRILKKKLTNRIYIKLDLFIDIF